ncbi:MAG: hypothetical protein IT356_09675 [Gemmatimonadaceae bacterium]|nr:hypothetical protein [Gemmatimonadaceae bacterium]
MKFPKLARAALALLAAVPAVAAAQLDPNSIKPGRDPKQPIDSAYTAKIREYTTEPFFLSPLVDYLPASKTAPTPAAVLGDIAGGPNKLPYSHEVYDYMRRLAKAAPGRVKVWSIGKTEEGREHLLVAVASEKLIAGLDANKAKMAKLADPRSINFDDRQAAKLISEVAPAYYITGTIHSTEAGAPTALMELAYRLAVDESPYIKNIRDHVITLMTPVVEVDGRDRMVDVYEWTKKHPGEVSPGVIYWGHYVRHDNNRDAMGLTLKLSTNVLDAFVDWNALVLHDLHESVPFLYDNTIGDGPYNSWLDPLLTNEWQMIGWNNVQEMTRFGMPGVFAHGDFDTWSPGYLMFMGATHNGISRLYETFGNGGTAETQERTISASDAARTWFRQNPPLPRVRWSLRNNNNYEQTGVLVSLAYIANNRALFLNNYWDKTKRAVSKPKLEGPAAYVLPASDPRLGAQAELLTVMQKQHVEISRAKSAFTVQVAAKSANGGGGRGGRGGAAGGDAGTTGVDHPVLQAQVPATVAREFPAGSYIIRMDQPYSRIADALLDYQYWSPSDPQKNPYDDTGWTFPEGFGTEAVRVADLAVLDVPVDKVTGRITAPGGVRGPGSVFAINANSDNALTTLRYRLKDADMQAAEEPFEANGQQFRRGSFIIRGVAAATLDATTKELGLTAHALAAAPGVPMHPLRAARVAVMHTWQNTQTEGWWRMALDFNGIPYDYISIQDPRKLGDLKQKYDVIIFGPGGGGGGVIEGMPMWKGGPIPWKQSPEMPNVGTWAQTDDIRPGMGYDGLVALQNFVKAGGVLITSGNTADFAMQNGFTNGVSTSTPQRGTVTGTFLRTRLVDDASPLTYGIADGLAVYTGNGQVLGVSAGSGGRGGGRGGAGGGQRETGRGTASDRDQTPGFQPLGPEFLPTTRAGVQPWQYAVPTEEQLRTPSLNIIPPDQRPRVALRFGAQNELLVSGLLSGGGDIAQRPILVDSPLEKGHVVLFSFNPLYRGETIGSYPLVFNAILNWDNLNAGRKLDPR